MLTSKSSDAVSTHRRNNLHDLRTVPIEFDIEQELNDELELIAKLEGKSIDELLRAETKNLVERHRRGAGGGHFFRE